MLLLTMCSNAPQSLKIIAICLGDENNDYYVFLELGKLHIFRSFLRIRTAWILSYYSGMHCEKFSRTIPRWIKRKVCSFEHKQNATRTTFLILPFSLVEDDIIGYYRVGLPHVQFPAKQSGFGSFCPAEKRWPSQTIEISSRGKKVEKKPKFSMVLRK